ncbi:DUF4331 domain-containing protein [Oceaniovalibus sp. ACAM 378]|uniref:DUF4331 domain-containing protein n=1 Tax=Oceaniovalibus sp. ACAM 378 TaxID=2599923 RepID=UPI0011D70E28|nr:DUF4331 domain-containing protein [Oceaniovalibus sp. ACAM 378]TYB83769.1 DUF4331 domain-containing protein [Oceaniovalibus sp. ACAM 378]
MLSERRKALVSAGAIIAAVCASTAWASSHREAPGITKMPKVDATDFYMFRSYEPGRQDMVTLIANYQPLQAPYGGPNYFTMDSDAVYEIHVDNDGDAIEDVTFQFQFSNTLANEGNGIALNVGGEMVAIPLRQAGMISAGDSSAQNEFESYTVRMIQGDRRSEYAGGAMLAKVGGGTTFAKPIDNIGNKTIGDYDAYANGFVFETDIPGCDTGGRVFVGQRAEAFAVNLGEIFDLINLVPIQGAPNPAYPQYDAATPFAGGITQDRANDDLIGRFNVTSIAIEVPIACVVGAGNGVIGAWTTASLPQARLLDPSPTYEDTDRMGGAYVQVARLSAPLVNEVVIGLPDKDLFNAAEPTQDGALATYVTNPALPELVELLFGGVAGLPAELAPNNFPRADLVAAFLTGFEGFNQQATVTGSEMMRLNTGVPPTALANQNVFGLVAEDLAGFPNGRRPADDTVDIALRVVMGALCHPVPLGQELSGDPEAEDNVNLMLCDPEDAPVGTAAFTDGAPINPTELRASFPYLNTPLAGSPN